MDFSPNLQRFRHSWLARALRRLTYACVVGDGDWPPSFVATDRSSAVQAPSRNVYVHLPFCESICPHCPYNTMRFDAVLDARYRDALLSEIRAYASRADALPVESLYFGGGTPSLVPESVAAVIDALRGSLTVDAEVAIEAYPTHATPARLDELRTMGVNRLSLGIEALDGALLKRLGRRYAPDEARAAMRAAKVAGFDMVDVNLIFGIPGQEVEPFLTGVGDCLAAGVDQISAYPLFTFDHTPAGQPKQEARYARANDGLRVRMQRGVSALCRGAGLERTSVWSFTRQGVSPYTTVTRRDYIGFGAGAGSKSREWASFNTFSVSAYIDAAPHATALAHRMSPRQQRADWLYWEIYNAHIDRAAYARQFGRSLERDFGALLLLLRAIGYLVGDETGYRLTESGAVWVHRLQSLFSLNGIDAVWTESRRTAWPRAVRVA